VAVRLRLLVEEFVELGVERRLVVLGVIDSDFAALAEDGDFILFFPGLGIREAGCEDGGDDDEEDDEDEDDDDEDEDGEGFEDVEEDGGGEPCPGKPDFRLDVGTGSTGRGGDSEEKEPRGIREAGGEVDVVLGLALARALDDGALVVC